MNIAMVEGNLTKDPEMRYTPNGKAVTEFSIAVNEGTGERRTTTYVDCIAWEEFAEAVAESARKGMRVTVTGKIETDTWVDKTTQQKRKTTRVKCYSVAIHPQRRQPLAAQRPQTRSLEDDEELDQLPF